MADFGLQRPADIAPGEADTPSLPERWYTCVRNGTQYGRHT